MAKHEYVPTPNWADFINEGSPNPSRKWITHVWREGTDNKGNYWGGWYWSNRTVNHERVRNSRRAWLCDTVGNHDIPFREWSREEGLSPWVLYAENCAMHEVDKADSPEPVCFRADDHHILCMNFGL